MLDKTLEKRPLIYMRPISQNDRARSSPSPSLFDANARTASFRRNNSQSSWDSPPRMRATSRVRSIPELIWWHLSQSWHLFFICSRKKEKERREKKKREMQAPTFPNFLRSLTPADAWHSNPFKRFCLFGPRTSCEMAGTLKKNLCLGTRFSRSKYWLSIGFN